MNLWLNRVKLLFGDKSTTLVSHVADPLSSVATFVLGTNPGYAGVRDLNSQFFLLLFN